MMATAIVAGLSMGASSKNSTVAKMSSNLHSGIPVNKRLPAPKAIAQHEDTSLSLTTKGNLFSNYDHVEESDPDLSSWHDLIVFQKSMLEKQWKLSFNQTATTAAPEENNKKRVIIGSGVSARQRRRSTRRSSLNQNDQVIRSNNRKQFHSIISPELLQTHLNGYVKGKVSEDLLPHDEVAQLSKKIKLGLMLEKHKARLKKRLGFEPADNELASSLRISPTKLRLMLLECSLARERLAMKNIRLVMSIAQKYNNVGPDMADLVQGGLIGLLRGIEKFDPSKGFKISTYVYWWIRQGVLKVLFLNSKTVRLPRYLCERLISIRNAKVKLERQGITPSVDSLADYLNMSERKVENATQADRMMISLEKEAFPSLNGRPGKTLHSYVADNNLENNPWQGFEDGYLKDEVNRLLHTTLSKREQDIVRLYHGVGRDSHTWEDIGKHYGLSRERVRQVGLVAFQKLKLAAKKQRMEALLVKH
ncbi:Sigma3 and sigma4 domains of RNA polymerase sigma factors protein [Dioscorea alata]|uniref:Sigma3 and sigma4 domains of RNA polymerase sigma factors protein n=3 Tax=Dioscorea alata TaxID=55571 RepID=A0ACB7WH43_DIOAL|nr:Sigma3 and sigma4 domains of RNA polymerase sigma factors protein [Dioscorea alata]KAH7687121.1 Sigma3 and sigma4 domains of RNA polymerase sigma factors protein [Dioscorea alata]KAH7687123.1 Sigma3 and sigma4 domains of RNA polymerase sigma factors protein [Dioscorea alata]